MLANVEVMTEVVSVKRSSALYNAHSYLTKVPENAIIPFIHNFTKPGDLIVDPFAGSGMTAVAALLTGRRAIVSDISRLGQHIGQNYCRVVDALELRRQADWVIGQCLNQYGADYTAACPACGQAAEIRRLVWSEVFACPICMAEIVFYDAVYDPQTKDKRRSSTCPNGHPFVKRASKRIGERPVEVHYACSCRDTIQIRHVTETDLAQINAIEERAITNWYPDVAFDPTTEMFKRCALEKNGRTHLADFFSHRNFNMLACLWFSINQIENHEYREKLRFAFTAILGRASKRYQWGPKRPLNAQNQTYYIAAVFYEWNVLDLFTRKVDAIIDAMTALPAQKDFTQESLWETQLPQSETTYHLCSAHELQHLNDASVDYVFTDPPFGSNIFYSDMNFFAEAWLGVYTDTDHEAVVQKASHTHKTLDYYQTLLTQAFNEIYRILKLGAWATIVFSSSNGAVWRAFQHAIREAGFVLEDTQLTILDKGQRSVKGLTSDTENVVTADLVLSFHKAQNGQKQDAHAIAPLSNLNAIVAQVISEKFRSARVGTKELSTTYLYLAIMQTCFRKHLDVEAVSLESVTQVLSSLGYIFNKRSQHWVAPTLSA